MTKDEFIEKFFPTVECGREPCGNKVTVQLRYIPKKKGGIILAGETRDFNKNATVVARIVKLGPIAFHDRSTGEVWKEGAWAALGDIVLMPQYGGMNRIEVPLPEDSEETVVFATFNDYEVTDRVVGNFELYSGVL